MVMQFFIAIKLMKSYFKNLNQTRVLNFNLDNQHT